ALLRAQSHRALLQSAQTLPRHRHALRQACEKFPCRGTAGRDYNPAQLKTGPSSASLTCDSVSVKVGSASTTVRAAAGTIACSSSIRFAANSLEKKLIPVRLPPGRARLVTRPILTGSSPTPKTMGIVVVAALAASAASGVTATIRATRLRTRSAAISGN